MKALIFFLLGCIVVLSIVGYVFRENGIVGYTIDKLFGDDKSVISEEFCLDHGHTIGEKSLDGETFKVCYFKHGGWCQIGDYYDGRCGEV